MTHDVIRIGTRKSPLAMAQAQEVARKITKHWPNIGCTIVGITTSGDKFMQESLADMGGKGLFTKELEEGLLNHTIDIAVHSMKDVPIYLPDTLIIPCLLPREDARDALISYGAKTLAELPAGCRFGTSSLRRSAQLLLLRPDITIVPLRGNVQTRITKIERGDADATMLAMAGLNRLGLNTIPAYIIPESECLPAVGQGAIGIECRKEDEPIRTVLAALNCEHTFAAVACERAFLGILDGSCRTPIAGFASITGKTLSFNGLLATPDGTSCKRSYMSGDIKDAEAIGRSAAEKILSGR